MKTAVQIRSLAKNYAARTALSNINLEVSSGAFFCLLGPNGSGKSTLFRILATLIPPTSGSAEIYGHDVVKDPAAARTLLGVVFQSPALDPKLRVEENLRYGGALYGLSGKTLSERITAATRALHIEERMDDPVETLSGGLQRRVELAKCFLSQPKVLLLDEPSSGLDPHARAEMWSALTRLREETGVTVLFTSHHLDDADRADHVAIFNRGTIVAEGDAASLRSSIPGNVMTIATRQPKNLAESLTKNFGLACKATDSTVVLHQVENAYTLASQISERFGQEVISLTIGSPTLEDVFFVRTGTRFADQEADV